MVRILIGVLVALIDVTSKLSIYTIRYRVLLSADRIIYTLLYETFTSKQQSRIPVLLQRDDRCSSGWKGLRKEEQAPAVHCRTTMTNS